MIILEKISAYGHENILCTHKTTIELTKENSITKRGNCILGIKATKSCIDLNPILKKHIKNEKKIKVSIRIENLTDSFYGFGNKYLTLLRKALFFIICFSSLSKAISMAEYISEVSS